jgi:hypothetical protein
MSILKWLRDGTKLSGRSYPDEVLTQPLVQITFATEGGADRILTLSPLGVRDYFTSLTMEYARDQPIAEPVFEKLAQALRIELTEALRYQVYETVIGTTLMIVRRWHSPRALLDLLKQLKRDPLGTIDRVKGDEFAEFMIAMIQDVAAQTGMLPRDVIKQHIAAIREATPRGRPDEEARSIFFETVVEIARRRGDKLALPERDDSRGHLTTPLFEFGSAMRDLVVDYGNAILDRRGLQRGRFDGFELDRERLISHLGIARRRILQETSMASFNSTNSLELDAVTGLRKCEY